MSIIKSMTTEIKSDNTLLNFFSFLLIISSNVFAGTVSQLSSPAVSQPQQNQKQVAHEEVANDRTQKTDSSIQNTQKTGVPSNVGELGSDQNGVDELIENRKKVLQQVEGLNQLNPLSNKSVSIENMPTELNVQTLPPGFQKIAPILKSEYVQRVIKKLQNPKLVALMPSLIGHPQLKALGIALFVLFLFFRMIKKRVLAATDRLIPRIFARLSLTLLFSVIYLTVMVLVLGEPFVEFIKIFYFDSGLL